MLATAMLVFFVYSTAAWSISVDRLMADLNRFSPGITAAGRIATRSLRLRNTIEADQLPGTLRVLMARLKATFALTLDTAGVSFFISLFRLWDPLVLQPKPGVKVEHGQE
jgi:hypothetical protein